MHSLENRPNLPPELDEIARQLKVGAVNAREAIQEVLSSGEYLLIGTAYLDVEVHEVPLPDIARGYDLSTKRWEAYRSEQGNPVLRATRLGSHAIICALFGDPNERGQRKHLSGANGPLTTTIPPPHFGWLQDGTTHALKPLIAKVRRRGPAIQGNVDVIRDDGTFYPDRRFVGEFYSPNSQRTLIHISMNGTDLSENTAVVQYETPADGVPQHLEVE